MRLIGIYSKHTSSHFGGAPWNEIHCAAVNTVTGLSNKPLHTLEFKSAMPEPYIY